MSVVSCRGMKEKTIMLHLLTLRLQTKVLNKLLDIGEGNFEGGLTNKKYRGITGTTQLTTSRHIKELVDKGFICEKEGHGGRSTCYEVVWDR